MNVVWMALALGIPAALLCQFVAGQRFGHGFLLAFGCWVYGVLPFVAYATDLYFGGPGYDIWSAAFQRMDQLGETALLVSALLVLGYGMAYLLPSPPPTKVFSRALDVKPLSLLLVLIAGLWLVFLFNARELLFSGYVLAYRPDLMGPLANVNLAVLLLYLNLNEWRQSAVLRWACAALLAVNSAALLSMGGRLYVAATLVGISVQWLNSAAGRRRGARLASLAMLGAAILGLAIVGLWRGDGEFQWDALGQIILAEPVLTSVSLGSLTDCSLVDIVNTPYNFVSSIINFIPSGLLPDKEALMVDLDPSGNCLAMPFGATHLGVALLVNFGVLGSMLVACVFAYLMRWLAGNGRMNWLYCYLCCLLPFMLFRDGFLIFNKSFFGTGLLLAALLVVASRPSPASQRHSAMR